jgi:hypothetical protein
MLLGRCELWCKNSRAWMALHAPSPMTPIPSLLVESRDTGEKKIKWLRARTRHMKGKIFDGFQLRAGLALQLRGYRRSSVNVPATSSCRGCPESLISEFVTSGSSQRIARAGPLRSRVASEARKMSNREGVHVGPRSPVRWR